MNGPQGPRALPSAVPPVVEYDSARRIVVRNLCWQGKLVHLDGYAFINCRFESCQLRSETLDYAFDRCWIGPGCTLEFPS